MHTEKMLEQSRNARKQCWITVEMHTKKMLEHSRNARKQCWNTVEMYTDIRLEMLEMHANSAGTQ